MKNKLSIRQTRTLFFLLAVGFHLISVLVFPRNRPNGYFVSSDFYNLFGLLALIPAFGYRINEKELFIHEVIEKNIEGDSIKVHLGFSIASTVLMLIGVYLSCRSVAQLGYISQGNFGLFKILLFLMWFTFSFWERRQQLKE